MSFNTHEIPASTIFALTQAKANGHKVFIATGRPPLIITNLGAIEHLIDGYVTINGALSFVGNEVVRCKDIPHDAARLVVDDAQQKRYGVIVTRGHRRGLLLPDLDGVDTVRQQVDIARRKAGISPGEDVSLQRFEVVRHT